MYSEKLFQTVRIISVTIYMINPFSLQTISIKLSNIHVKFEITFLIKDLRYLHLKVDKIFFLKTRLLSLVNESYKNLILNKLLLCFVVLEHQDHE